MDRDMARTHEVEQIHQDWDVCQEYRAWLGVYDSERHPLERTLGDLRILTALSISNQAD